MHSIPNSESSNNNNNNNNSTSKSKSKSSNKNNNTKPIISGKYFDFLGKLDPVIVENAHNNNNDNNNNNANPPWEYTLCNSAWGKMAAADVNPPPVKVLTPH